MLMRTSTTLYAFAAYLAILAAVLLFIPNVLLGLFGLGETREVWIRIIGMLVLFLGVFYVRMAQENNIRFAETTVYLRACVMIFFAVFVALNFAPPSLLFFALVDMIGAAWTWYALQKGETLGEVFGRVQKQLKIK